MPDYVSDAGIDDSTQTSPDYLGDAGLDTTKSPVSVATQPKPDFSHQNAPSSDTGYFQNVVSNPQVNPNLINNDEVKPDNSNIVGQGIKTADEWANTLFNTPFQGIKSALIAPSHGQSMGEGFKQGITGKGPLAETSMTDVKNNYDLQEGNLSPIQQEINENVEGPALELGANPINFADLGMPGATKLAGGAIDYLGDLAKTGATKISNSALAQKAGDLISPALNAKIPLTDTSLAEMAGKTGEAIQNLKEGLRPYPQNPDVAKWAQDKDLLNSYTAQKINPQTEEEQRKITDAAIQHLDPSPGMKEGSKEDIADRVNRLQKMILDVWEPEGSQSPMVGHDYETSVTTPNAEGTYTGKGATQLTPDEQLQQQARQSIIDAQKRENISKLPYDVQDYAEHVIEQNKNRALINQQKMPGFNEILNYAQHNFTPEMTDFLNKNFNNTDRPLVAQALSDLGRNNVKVRGVPTTINELNNVSSAGKLSKQPGMGGWKLLDQFKKPVFNENAVDLATSTNLKSAHAENHYDFMQKVAQNFGKTREQVLNNPSMAHMTLVQDPTLSLLHPDSQGEMYFPKEIGDFLNRGKELAHNQGGVTNKIMGFVGSVMKGTSDLTKRVNFGLWPGSMAKIYADNNMLAYMGGIWHPESMYRGFDLASDLRRPNIPLDDRKVFLSTPTTAYTKKQVMDLAQRYGGIGMGRSKAELQSINPGRSELAPMKGMWEAHQFVEDSTRLGGFIEALRQGKTPEEAGALTRKVFYDYSAMGPVDKAFQKYIPFYIFARKNVPAMIKTAIQKPGQWSLPERARQIANKPIQDQQNMNNENQEGNKPLNIGDNQTLNAKMLMPETAMNEMMGSGKTLGEAVKNTPGKAVDYGLGMINPFIRTGAEEVLGRNLQTGKPIARMPGEVGAKIGGIDIPKQVTYPFEQGFRPLTELKNATNENKTPMQRFLRAFTNLNVNTTDSNKQKLNQAWNIINSIKGSGGSKTGGMADVEYYARQWAKHLDGPDKDEYQAGIDEDNTNIALKHLTDAANAIKK